MPDALTTLSDALQADDPSQVESATESVLEEFDARRQREDALEDLLVAVDARTPDRTTTPEGTAAEDLQVAIVELEQARLDLDTAIVGYLSDETGADEALAAVDAVSDARTTVDSRTDDLTDALAASERTLPPVLTLTGPSQRVVPKGDSVELSYTLENLGGTATDSISVTLDESVPLSVSQPDLEPLAPNTETTVVLAGTPDSNGVSEGLLKAEGAGRSATAELRLVVAAKADYLTTARNDAESLATTAAELQSDDESESGSNSKNGNNGGGASGGGLAAVENKARTTVKRLERLIDRIESGRTNARQLDQKIAAVEELVETITVTLNGEGTTLTATERAVFENTTSGILDSLEAARDADL